MLADKETKSSDDAPLPQPGLSASALLKEHEKTMKNKKHSQGTISSATADGHRLANTCNVPSLISTDSSNIVPSSSQESERGRDASVTEPKLAQQHDRSSEGVDQESSHRMRPDVEQEPSRHLKRGQHKVPELGRGLNLGDNGLVDLDDIPCTSTQSSVSADPAKVS